MLQRIIKISIICFCLFFLYSCNTLDLKNDLEIQKETEHFKIYCYHNNLIDVEELSKELENNYESFSSHLQVKLSKKIDIIIYPNINLFYNVVAKKENMSKNEVPDWVAAIPYRNSIHMISPSNTEYKRNPQNIHLQSAMSLAEIIIKNINKKAPYYLIQSVPRYEAKLYSGIKEDIISDFTNNTFPTLQQVINMNKQNNVASLSYFTLTEYIIDKYGYDEIIKLIDDKDIEKCLGKSKNEIENEWINYVKLTYAEEGFELSTETEHFIIQYNKSDADIANNIIKTLENNYERITKNFNVNSSKKYNIIIYPTANIFKKTRLHDVPNGIHTNSVTGYFLPETNKIKILSPNDPDSWSLKSNLENLSIHEFTHAVIMQINPAIPSYLNEGIANYMSNDMETSRFLLTIVSSLKDNSFPSINDIENMQVKDYSDGTQHFECAFVMYIVENYGYQKLIEYIKTPDVQTIFNITKDEFQKDLLEFLKRKYIY